MTERLVLTFDESELVDEAAVVRALAGEMGNGDERGTMLLGDETIRWSLRRIGPGVDIDRRQRLAAANLLCAFDLPQNMLDASHSMLEAAAVCPGMTTADLPFTGAEGRRPALLRAKALIDEMLSETET